MHQTATLPQRSTPPTRRVPAPVAPAHPALPATRGAGTRKQFCVSELRLGTLALVPGVCPQWYAGPEAARRR